MTNEDRNTIIELIEDLRAYARDWEWKYGEEWDAKILHVASILTALSAGEGLREAIQAFSDELDDWTNARPVPPVDFMTMQCGPKMVEAWDKVIRALSAPAPQEER